MTLLPTGRRLHLETIADGLGTALSNPEGIKLVAQNGSIALYTAGLTDNSFGASAIGRFLIDPNAGGIRGEIIEGGAGDDRLTGTGGADIIIDGAGSDRMWGGQWDEDFDPVAATVYRLYLATLNRTPDVQGQKNWANAILEGERSLLEAADGFVRSAEFGRTYGDVTDETFVTLLFNNVLGRTPAESGLQNWTNFLAGGQHGWRLL